MLEHLSSYVPTALALLARRIPGDCQDRQIREYLRSVRKS